VGKTIVIYVMFLLILASVSWRKAYSKNNTGTVFFLRHGVAYSVVANLLLEKGKR